MPQEQERRVDELVREPNDQGRHRVEERRLALEVEDARDRIVAKQSDVEQLIRAVQQSVVKAETEGIGNDA